MEVLQKLLVLYYSENRSRGEPSLYGHRKFSSLFLLCSLCLLSVILFPYTEMQNPLFLSLFLSLLLSLFLYLSPSLTLSLPLFVCVCVCLCVCVCVCVCEIGRA